ncbi:hypothetical protein B9Z55_006023 [Caenorhabditis nigoni]|uniref:Uncharacterized protein n=1 Tax=Caenorhabditis nigoni TaxID=1611254 RepID=A0A2G5V444_9PELO|nr:hypothetical protein B9Z55_006023 [Caenorhabditis nigoni]
MSANICVDDHELYDLFKRQSIPTERYQATDFRKAEKKNKKKKTASGQTKAPKRPATKKPTTNRPMKMVQLLQRGL